MISARPPALDPQEGWGVLVTIANEGKRFEKLAALWRWSLNRMPNPIVYRELIFTLFDIGKFDEAEAALREMMAKFPEERNGRSLILLGQIQARAGKNDDAVASVREAIRQEPNDAEAVRTLAILLNQAGKPDEAIETVRGVLKVDPNNPELNSLLGNLLTQVGRHDEAIAFYKGLLEKFPNNDEIGRLAHSGLSIVYTGLGDFAKGEAELEILFVRDPNDAGVNNDLGYLYADQGKNLEKAESMIRKAVAEEPDNSAYLDSLGWVLFKRGKYEEAKEPLERAATTPRGEDATIQDHLGDVYFQLRDHSRARAAWERAQTLAGQSKPPDKRLPEILKKLQSLKQVESSPRPSTGANP